MKNYFFLFCKLHALYCKKQFSHLTNNNGHFAHIPLPGDKWHFLTLREKMIFSRIYIGGRSCFLPAFICSWIVSEASCSISKPTNWVFINTYFIMNVFIVAKILSWSCCKDSLFILGCLSKQCIASNWVSTDTDQLFG